MPLPAAPVAPPAPVLPAVPEVSTAEPPQAARKRNASDPNRVAIRRGETVGRGAV
jgi:hypothetical protein